MLRLLRANAAGAEQLQGVAMAVPLHRVAILVRLARQYAEIWQAFAQELDGRARIIDPSAASRLMASAGGSRHVPADPLSITQYAAITTADPVANHQEG